MRRFRVKGHACVPSAIGTSDEMLFRFLRLMDAAPYFAGEVQPKLNQMNLKTIPFSASGFVAPVAFKNLVKPLLQLLRRHSEENRALIQMRGLLLPRLMSSEIRLSEAERAVGGAAA